MTGDEMVAEIVLKARKSLEAFRQKAGLDKEDVEALSDIEDAIVVLEISAMEDAQSQALRAAKAALTRFGGG